MRSADACAPWIIVIVLASSCRGCWRNAAYCRNATSCPSVNPPMGHLHAAAPQCQADADAAQREHDRQEHRRIESVAQRVLDTSSSASDANSSRFVASRTIDLLVRTPTILR